MEPNIVNPAKCAGQAVNGGTIALRHPRGCTGTKLTVALFNEMRRRKKKVWMVTIPLRRDRSCVGTGQGAASVFELLN